MFLFRMTAWVMVLAAWLVLLAILSVGIWAGLFLWEAVG